MTFPKPLFVATILLAPLAAIGVIAAFLTAPGAPTQSASSRLAGETVIIGSGAPGDLCTVKISASVREEIEKMGVWNWARACEEALAAAKG